MLSHRYTQHYFQADGVCAEAVREDEAVIHSAHHPFMRRMRFDARDCLVNEAA